ncbi:MAG: hypothetical protein M0009_14195 [Deltaproteobacteria bacterium]|nr:hypothetical protein [Deltaproteobacteria bacterium]
MKTKKLSVIGKMMRCMTIAVCLCVLGTVTAEAQGVDWTVTIRNPTAWDAGVGVYHLFTWKPDVTDIPAGATRTIHLGANCPTGMWGYLHDGQSRQMQGTDMYGTWYDQPYFGAASCGHHRFYICPTPQRQAYLGLHPTWEKYDLQKKDFSFCKE